MKRYFKLIACAVTVALAACCSVEDSDNPRLEEMQLTIKACGEGYDSVGLTETRTVRNEKTKATLWCKGDKISLFYGSGSNGGSIFTSVQEEDTVKVTNFTGTVGVISGGADVSVNDTYFWGLYPYNSTAECDGSSITTTLPSSQEAVPGTFANNLFPSMGHSQGIVMGFYNICGGFRFTINKQGVKKATFRGNNGEKLAGRIKVSLVDDRPSVQMLDGEEELVLTARNGEDFEVGKYYYFVMVPTVFSKGFTVKVETKTEEAFFEYKNSIEVVRSGFKGKTNMDNDMTFLDKDEDESMYPDIVELSSSEGDYEASNWTEDYSATEFTVTASSEGSGGQDINASFVTGSNGLPAVDNIQRVEYRFSKKSEEISRIGDYHVQFRVSEDGESLYSGILTDDMGMLVAEQLVATIDNNPSGTDSGLNLFHYETDGLVAKLLLDTGEMYSLLEATATLDYPGSSSPKEVNVSFNGTDHFRADIVRNGGNGPGITGISFIPQTMVDGVPGFETCSFFYTPLACSNLNSSSEIWQPVQGDGVQVPAPTTIQYHVNGTNPVLDDSFEYSIIMKDVTNNSSKYLSSEDFSITPTFLSYDNGVLSLSVTVYGKEASENHISLFALRITKGDFSVVSDYATVKSTDLTNLRIACPMRVSRNLHEIDDEHYRRGTVGISFPDSEDAYIPDKPAWTSSQAPEYVFTSCDMSVPYNGALDLKTVTIPHYNLESDSYDFEMTAYEMDAYGFYFTYEVVKNFNVGGVNQSNFVMLSDGVVYGVGDCIGKTPIIRVNLMHGYDVVEVAYFKVYITETAN